MSAITTLRDALFGNPPVPSHEPSREGTLQAFEMMQAQLDAATVGMAAYATVAALPTGANLPANGTQARVYADATASNNTVWLVKAGAWVKDVDFVAALATVVEPFVDAAEAHAIAAAGAVSGINRLNMWSDEGFALSGGNFSAKNNGLNLYHTTMRNATWQPNVKFDAGVGAWRHPANNTLFGVNLELGHAAALQMKLGVGDVFSMAMRVRGLSSGAGVAAAYRFFNGADTSYDGSSQSAVATITTNGDVQTIKRENVTWPANKTGCAFYCFGTATLGEFDVLDVWFVRGPTAGDVPPVRRNDTVLNNTILERTSVGRTVEQANAISILKTRVTYDTRTVVNEAINPTSAATRDVPFSGWADSYNDVDSSNWDALQLRVLNRSAAATQHWSKVKFVALTHATNPRDAGAVLIGVGEAYVDKNEVPLRDVVGLWRNPANNEPRRITPQMRLGKTLVGYYCVTDEGADAACSEILGSTSGLTRAQSYYHSSGDPLTGPGWLPFSGNPSMGLEMVTYTNPVSQDVYLPKSEWVEAEISEMRNQDAFSRTNRIAGGRLVQFRRYMTNTTLGTPGRFVFGMVGDSWTASAQYFQTIFTKLMIARFGDGGIGFCSTGYSSVSAPSGTGADARHEYFRIYTGAWTSNYRAGSTSPDCSDIRSSTPGARFHLYNAGNNTNPALSAAKLHFTGTSDGVIKWRWNGGAWSADTNVQGGVGVQQTLDLTGFPTNALTNAGTNTRSVEIEVVSGSVILCGVDLQSSTNGVVFHKLGSSGATIQTYMANDATQWQNGFAALACNAVSVCFGTNEQAQAQAPDAFVTHATNLVARLRAARPICDVLLSTPPENVTSTSVPMSKYASALAEIVNKVNVAVLDWQPAFGRASAPAEYGPASSFPLIRADPHPDIVNDRGPIALATELDLMWRTG